MRGNFNDCLDEVLLHEGGWSDHPSDPGGATMMGVTKATYEGWIGRKVDKQTMRNLKLSDVHPIYKARYWDEVKGDELPAGLDMCIFDFAVNAGPARAARYLQRLVGVTEDGKIGPRTMNALLQYIRARGIAYAIMRYQDMRRDYYKMLKTFPTFGRGWLRRVDEVESASMRLVRRNLKLSS